MTVLVTGAAGQVGRTVVELLRGRGAPVRALVHRDDRRAEGLRELGADVKTGDLCRPADVAAALDGCERVLFSMSVSPDYLEAAGTLATVARSNGSLEVLVNLSQMTVSDMTPTSGEESHQHRLHWLSEQLIAWSGLPHVFVRPTVFLENPLFTMLDDGHLRLPFGTGHTSPVSVADVAGVSAAILEEPGPHVGKVYELTGPESLSMDAVADAYSRALDRPVTYEDVPFGPWSKRLDAFPAHLRQHLLTMARLHHEHRYGRVTDTVERLTGHAPQGVEAFVAEHRGQF